MAQKTVEKNLLIGQQSQTDTKKKTDPNQLIMTWLRTVKFKEEDRTSVNIKLSKNKDYMNTKMLIKTNNFKKNNDGSVTINFQLTIQGLKDLNRFTYNALKMTTEHMKEREPKKEEKNNSEKKE